jgi:hypothetical protein
MSAAAQASSERLDRGLKLGNELQQLRIWIACQTGGLRRTWQQRAATVEAIAARLDSSRAMQFGQSQPEAENGTRSVCKIFLGVAALPDGERLWTFFCLRPEFIISIRERQLIRVHRVTALIDASDEPRRPGLLPEDHWIRQVVHSAPPVPSLTRQRA